MSSYISLYQRSCYSHYTCFVCQNNDANNRDNNNVVSLNKSFRIKEQIVSLFPSPFTPFQTNLVFVDELSFSIFLSVGPFVDRDVRLYSLQLKFKGKVDCS